MIGPIINSTSTLIGGIVGGLIGDRLSEKFRTALPLTFGAASMGMGITVIIKLHALPVVVASLLFGAIIGEIFSIEKRLAAAHLNYVLLSIKLPRKKRQHIITRGVSR